MKAIFETAAIKPKIKSENGPNIVFECVLQDLDKPGLNGRMYPKILMEQQFKKIEPKIKSKMLYGELDHPISDNVDRIGQTMLKEVSHVLLDYQIEDDKVFGRIRTLPTPNGSIVKQLVLDGDTIGVSLRALGSVQELGSNKSIVEDLEIISYDIVSNPSFDTAIINKQMLVESAQYVFETDVKWQHELYKYVFAKQLELLFESRYGGINKKIKRFLQYITSKI